MPITSIWRKCYCTVVIKTWEDNIPCQSLLLSTIVLHDHNYVYIEYNYNIVSNI